MVSKRIERLRQKAAGLPMRPGVYLMKDSSSTVIYVGKSRKLKNRVSSYFVDTDKGIKTERMVSRVADFDYILCDTEMEALTLENVLIKQYSPRYNIKLKDAKSYPYIKIPRGPYPKPEVTRQRRADGGQYFGPYRSASAAYEALETVRSIFALPSCKHSFPKDTGRVRPCLYRQMGRCCAPCVPDVEPDAYAALIDGARRVFEGHTSAAESELTRRMYEASDAELFELAAHYRNGIEALRQLSEKQKVVTDEADERDVFSLWEGESAGVLAVLQIRGGKLLYKNEYTFSAAELTESGDLLALLTEYYRDKTPPREVLLDTEAEEEDLSTLSDYLSQLRGARVYVKTPKRGTLRHLCELARDNAKQKAETRLYTDAKAERTLARLASLLALETLPERIEAYDVSNLGHEEAVCSMVVFEDGEPKRSDYRTFRIRTADGADDYGAMEEALSRRLAHIGDGTASLGERPDLILLDGGVGHVHTILPLTAPLEIPTFGMVKDDFHKTRCLTDGDCEISIATEAAVYGLVFAIQEEAHRVALRHMTARKRKTLRRSTLTNVPGIGPAKAKALLSAFGTIGAVKEASPEELMRVRGIHEADAYRIRAYYENAAKKAKTPSENEKTEE